MEDRYIKFLIEYLTEQHEIRQSDKKLIAKNIEKELRELDANINNVVNSFASTQSEVVRKKLEEKIEELEARKEMLQRQNTQTTKERDFKKTLEYAGMFFANPGSIWKSCSIDDKRMFLKLVFRNNLEVNKKLEEFGTLPIRSLFLLKDRFLQSNVSVIGDGGRCPHVGKA